MHDMIDAYVEPADAPPSPDVDLLEPFGLGWRWKWRSGRTWVQMTFRGVRRTSSGPSAEVTIEAGVPQVGVRGVLTVERLALGHGDGRVKLANRLSKRTGEGDQAAVNWRNLIDGVCSRILRAQQQGPERKSIGLAPEVATSWLIDGLVEEHQTTSLYGDGEVGKSWQGLAACVSLAAGLEVIPGWRPSRRARSLYLDYETDEETLNKRVRMICRGAGIDYVPVGYVACDAPLVDQLEWLLERVHDEAIDLVVVDSVEAAMAGTRSEGGDMNDTAAKMNAALRKLGRSVLLIDHISSINAQSKGLAGKAYGSVFKRNWVRMAYELKRVHESADGEKHLGVYCTKRNNGPRFDAFGLRWTITEELSAWAREEIREPDLVAALSTRRRMEIALEEAGEPLSALELSQRCDAPIATIRVELSRDKGRAFARQPDGMWLLTSDVARRAGEQDGSSRPRLEVVNAADDDPEPLPFA